MEIYENPGGFNESLNKYCLGGLHPVLLGDEYENGRYVIFRKLAYGSWATIWLARDRVQNRYVALRFPRALKEGQKPLRLLERSGHPGEAHVNLPLDYFVVEGPNGSHLCEALEVVGRSFTEILDEAPHPQVDSPTELWSKYDASVWSMAFSRRVCRHALLGLDYLHSRGIAHRDIHKGNLSLALTYDLDSLTEDEIQEELWCHAKPTEDNTEDMVGTPVVAHTQEWKQANLEKTARSVQYTKRLDGKPLQAGEIAYRVFPARLKDKLVIDNAQPRGTQSFRAVLIDLEPSCPFEECSKHSISNPPNSRSPEVILDLPAPYQSDIFSLGLMMWSLVMWRDLVESRSGDEYKNRHLRDLVNRLGPMPDDLRLHWPEASEWLNPDGTARSVEEDDECEYGPEDYEYGDMSQVAKLYQPRDMDDGQLACFLDLVGRMLPWDPKQRASTQELLEHPWIKGDEEADTIQYSLKE